MDFVESIQSEGVSFEHVPMGADTTRKDSLIVEVGPSLHPAPVDLEDAVVLRNLSEPDAGKILYDSFKTAINALTISDAGSTRIEDRIRYGGEFRNT